MNMIKLGEDKFKKQKKNNNNNDKNKNIKSQYQKK